MTALLVSVRSAAEAEAALRGGAALIDVKEPRHGSLCRAKDEVIAEVVRLVAGRCPVSAALGELADRRFANLLSVELPLSYVKWGLAGYQGGEQGWCSELNWAMQSLSAQLPNCRVVAVAYADWQRAGAPKPEEICTFAIENATGAFLLDTWKKDGSTLLDWLPRPEIERLIECCRCAGAPIALAGSLGPAEIQTLLPLCPDWFAVRGAVCQGRRRGAAIDEDKVQQLVETINRTIPVD